MILQLSRSLPAGHLITLLLLFTEATVALFGPAPSDDDDAANRKKTCVPLCCPQPDLTFDPDRLRCVESSQNNNQTAEALEEEARANSCGGRRHHLISSCTFEAAPKLVSLLPLHPSMSMSEPTSKEATTSSEFRLPSGAAELVSRTQTLSRIELKLSEGSVVSSFVRAQQQRKKHGGHELHSPPSSFCIVPGYQAGQPEEGKALVCPRPKPGRHFSVKKCCPFGQELKYPADFRSSAYECRPAGSARKDWRIRLDGYFFPLQDLIRIPYERLTYDRPFECPSSSSSSSNLVMDVEAFELDSTGSLVFTSLFGSKTDSLAGGRKNFCVDGTTVKNEAHLMVALFCTEEMVPASAMRIKLPANEGVGPVKSTKALVILHMAITVVWNVN